MEPQTFSWEQVENLATEIALKPPTETEIESLFRNFDHNNLVAPLREVREAQRQIDLAREGSEGRRRAALELQKTWEEWLVRREMLRNDLKRGKEALEQTRCELANLQNRLEEWTDFERVCGKNPLRDYMEAIVAHEKIEAFLPGWLKRKEEQLAALSHSLEECARQNGLEHLL